MTTPLELSALAFVRQRLVADVDCPTALKTSLLAWCGWSPGADNELERVGKEVPTVVLLPPAKRAYRRRVPGVDVAPVEPKVKGKPGRKARIVGLVTRLEPRTLTWGAPATAVILESKSPLPE